MDWPPYAINCPNTVSIVLDANELKDELPTKSFLEACVRLWTIGDFFSHKPLTSTALQQLTTRLQDYFMQGMHFSVVRNGIPFIGDLEAAIRVAFATDSIDGPFRQPLLEQFLLMQRYLHKHPSCATLLEDTPDFALVVAKATMGLGPIPNANGSFGFEYWGRCVTCETLVEVRPNAGPIPLGIMVVPEPAAVFHGPSRSAWVLCHTCSKPKPDGSMSDSMRRFLDPGHKDKWYCGYFPI